MSLSLGVPDHEVGVKVSLLCVFWTWNVERGTGWVWGNWSGLFWG